MNTPVKIKSYPSGITILLSPDLEFDALVSAVKDKFTESGGFFKNARLAIEFEGRSLSEEEESELLKVISMVSGIHVVCVIGQDKETENRYLRAVQQMEKTRDEAETTDADCLFHKGSVRKGEVITSMDNIVILGDVQRGASIVSSKDIAVFGGLYGKVHAGAEGEFGHRVLALVMEPEELKIGDLTFEGKVSGSKWGIRSKLQPKTAFQDQDRIAMEPYGGK